MENVLNKFELPKARLAQTLPSRPVDSTQDVAIDDDDDDESGMWDRQYAKQQSSKNLKMQQKKAARQTKIDATNSKPL